MFALFLFIGTRAVNTMLLTYLLTAVKLTAIFSLELAEHMGVSSLTGKRLKNVRSSAVSDNLLQ